MDVGSVNLGPGGHVVITGDLNGAFQSLGQSSTTTGMTIASMNLDRGQFVIGGDSLEPISIAGDLSLSHNGLFAIGRDQTGTLSVGGSVILDSGGQLSVGRNLAALMVGGNVLIGPVESGIVVGGDLDAMNVGGYFSGQGSATAIDLGVGLNLDGLTVLGGGANQGGIQSANINVGKNISGLDVLHGIFRSWITAGVSINGVNNVGADGVTGIYNSEIDAGTSITNVIVGGDVTSGFPTGDTSGYPTRIIAGKIRSTAIGSTPDQGVYLPNGSISNLMITGGADRCGAGRERRPPRRRWKPASAAGLRCRAPEPRHSAGSLHQLSGPRGPEQYDAELFDPQRHQWCAHGTCGLGSACRQPA